MAKKKIEDIQQIGKYQIRRKLRSSIYDEPIYECIHRNKKGNLETYFLILVKTSDKKVLSQYWPRKEIEIIIDDCLYNLVVENHFVYNENNVCIPMKAKIPRLKLRDPESKRERYFRKTRYMGEVAAGTVYKVERLPESHEDPRIYGRGIYALYMLNPNIRPEYQALERFKQQAKIQSTLQHKHIQKVHLTSESKDGMCYAIMDFKMGKSLDEFAGEISISEAIYILEQISSALAHVHEHKIIHRDINPRNILYPKKNISYLTGFFFAKELNPMDNLINTAQGLAIGTLEYSSPEQVQGMPLDEKSDMYSLAFSVYAVLTGSYPYEVETKSDLTQAIIGKPLPKLSKNNKFSREERRTILREVDEVLQKMTEKNPNERYKNMRQVENMASCLLDRLGRITNLEEKEVLKKKKKLKKEEKKNPPQISPKNSSRYMILLFVIIIAICTSYFMNSKFKSFVDANIKWCKEYIERLQRGK